ncbi:MAG: lipocalin family protein [Cyclobacteriaceae bacterium]
MNRLILVCLFLFLGASVNAQSFKKEIVGKWMIKTVTQDERDVSIKHNPRNERYIELFADGTFKSDGYPYGPNTGKYALDKRTLFIDSDSGEEDDSSWRVVINGNEMYWVGVGSQWAEQFKISYTKTK